MQEKGFLIARFILHSSGFRFVSVFILCITPAVLMNEAMNLAMHIPPSYWLTPSRAALVYHIREWGHIQVAGLGVVGAVGCLLLLWTWNTRMRLVGKLFQWLLLGLALMTAAILAATFECLTRMSTPVGL